MGVTAGSRTFPPAAAEAARATLSLREADSRLTVREVCPAGRPPAATRTPRSSRCASGAGSAGEPRGERSTSRIGARDVGRRTRGTTPHAGGGGTSPVRTPARLPRAERAARLRRGEAGPQGGDRARSYSTAPRTACPEDGPAPAEADCRVGLSPASFSNRLFVQKDLYYVIKLQRRNKTAR